MAAWLARLAAEQAIKATVAVVGVLTGIWAESEAEKEDQRRLDDYPTNPDEWQLPRGWREETKAKEATDGRHRHFVGPKGETRQWDREGRPYGKERGPHWKDSRFPGKHIECTR